MLTTVVRARERIPEAFIWQAFHDFAKTAHHMRTVHFDERVAPPGRDHYVLHLDLKHENGTPRPVPALHSIGCTLADSHLVQFCWAMHLPTKVS